MSLFKSIRFQLSLWFIGSLISLSLFFYYVIHIFMWPYGDLYFVLLIILLGLVGLLLIYNATASLANLTKGIAAISDKNLDQKIEGVENDNEVGQLAQTFNALLDRIHQAFERERQFIGDVTHELKTPLAVLSGTLENALAKDRSHAEYREALEKSLEESRRLSVTLNNLLDLAWTEAPQQQQLKKISLSDLMREVAEIAQGLAEAKEITVHQEIEDDVYCYGNKDKLARAVLNLVDNAIKFSPNQSAVAIELSSQSGKAAVTIKDSGPGIPTQEYEQIFVRFYRSQRTQDKPGTGLGLALVKSIIRLHKGQIAVAANQPLGSVFTITLPHA